MHWTAHYIGEPYRAGDNDCAAFAARVRREVFGHDIRLPTERAFGARGRSRQIAELQADYAAPTAEPREGDAVLMRGRGRLNHIGIYARIGTVPYVLHAMKDAGQVCLHRLRDLPRHGLELEGYYRWV